MRASVVAGCAAATLTAVPTAAHHGLGRFDRARPVEIEGTIKSIDFVNPHSYLNLDVVGARGDVVAMRCEMRAATLLRRSGWSKTTHPMRPSRSIRTCPPTARILAAGGLVPRSD